MLNKMIKKGKKHNKRNWIKKEKKGKIVFETEPFNG